jgi:hypothetical protein
MRDRAGFAQSFDPYHAKVLPLDIRWGGNIEGLNPGRLAYLLGLGDSCCHQGSVAYIDGLTA